MIMMVTRIIDDDDNDDDDDDDDDHDDDDDDNGEHFFQYRLLIHYDIYLMTNCLKWSYLYCRCCWFEQHFNERMALKVLIW